MDLRTQRLNVIAIGGAHQFPHFLPVAFELHRRGKIGVRIFAPTISDAQDVDRLAKRIGFECPPVTIMRLPGALESLLSFRRTSSVQKVIRLLLYARRLCDCDALLSAERTSTLLKRLPGSCPMLLHIPHGAGDRAVGFENRLSLFDHVMVAGAKDKARMLAEGVAMPDTCHVIGPVKMDSMKRVKDRSVLFNNDRPTIFYNPHFSKDLTSFSDAADPLIEWVAKNCRYNLVIAPHVRLAAKWPPEKIARWEARSIPDQIIVDMGSQRSIDMTYTMAADIYIGDVSSQIYEFISQPRPCVFVNSHGADWEADPNYAMWHFGPVVDRDDNLIAAIEDAFSSHKRYIRTQCDAAVAALGGAENQDGKDSIGYAADLIQGWLSSDQATGR